MFITHQKYQRNLVLAALCSISLISCNTSAPSTAKETPSDSNPIPGDRTIFTPNPNSPFTRVGVVSVSFTDNIGATALGVFMELPKSFNFGDAVNSSDWANSRVFCSDPVDLTSTPPEPKPNPPSAPGVKPEDTLKFADAGDVKLFTPSSSETLKNLSPGFYTGLLKTTTPDNMMVSVMGNAKFPQFLNIPVPKAADWSIGTPAKPLPLGTTFTWSGGTNPDNRFSLSFLAHSNKGEFTYLFCSVPDTGSFALSADIKQKLSKMDSITLTGTGRQVSTFLQKEDVLLGVSFSRNKTNTTPGN
jgi:hypothetical protein